MLFLLLWLVIPGRYHDIWGFAVDVPRGMCADPYLHGVQIPLSGDPGERSITVFAAYAMDEYRTVHDFAADAEHDNLNGDPRGVSHRKFVIGGITGERWIARQPARVREDVYVLRRALGAGKNLDYEYIFTLVTTASDHERDRRLFDAFLRSVAFTEPDR